MRSPGAASEAGAKRIRTWSRSRDSRGLQTERFASGVARTARRRRQESRRRRLADASEAYRGGCVLRARLLILRCIFLRYLQPEHPLPARSSIFRESSWPGRRPSISVSCFRLPGNRYCLGFALQVLLHPCPWASFLSVCWQSSYAHDASVGLLPNVVYRIPARDYIRGPGSWTRLMENPKNRYPTDSDEAARRVPATRQGRPTSLASAFKASFWFQAHPRRRRQW